MSCWNLFLLLSVIYISLSDLTSFKFLPTVWFILPGSTFLFSYSATTPSSVRSCCPHWLLAPSPFLFSLYQSFEELDLGPGNHGQRIPTTTHSLWAMQHVEPRQEQETSLLLCVDRNPARKRKREQMGLICYMCFSTVRMPQLCIKNNLESVNQVWHDTLKHPQVLWRSTVLLLYVYLLAEVLSFSWKQRRTAAPPTGHPWYQFHHPL